VKLLIRIVVTLS